MQTVDADKDRSLADYITFDLPSTADIYVAYDDAATSLPGWLSGFTPTAQTLTTNHPSAPVLRVYELTGVSGTQVLGGADASTTGAGANYLVIVVD